MPLTAEDLTLFDQLDPEGRLRVRSTLILEHVRVMEAREAAARTVVDRTMQRIVAANPIRRRRGAR